MNDLERGRQYLGKQATARFVTGGSPGEGRVVAYSGTPMVLIKQADGEKFWWDVALCEFSAERVPPIEHTGERKRWVVYTDDSVSSFTAIEIGERHVCNFDDPTTYPMATALPIVFDNFLDAHRCAAWMERLIGRFAMAHGHTTKAEDIARQVRTAITQMGSRR